MSWYISHTFRINDLKIVYKDICWQCIESNDIIEELEGFEPAEDELEDSVTKEDEYLEDKVEDRKQDHELKGKKLQVLYESGWFTGEILYYNEQLDEYKVTFDDDTSDFIKPSDIDGIEVKLV